MNLAKHKALLVFTSLLAASSVSAAGFTNLHSFSALSAFPGTNSDGANPQAGLVSSGSTLYGTTVHGGTNGLGTVFAINTDGTGFANLHNFNDFKEGQGPLAAMVLSGSTLYGTTRVGGTNGLGNVFAIGTNGTGFISLHSFGLRLGADGSTGRNTNSGGAFPETDLLLSGNTLYGATEQGGSGGGGTVFKINTDGSGFILLHNFTNVDGNYPSTRMVLSGSNLFGTTVFGGSGPGTGRGTVFRVNTDGSGFTNLYQFSDAVGNHPLAGLVLSGSTLFGTTSDGFLNTAYGSVFKINTDGTGFTDLFNLDPNAGEGHPTSGLAINDTTIYATSLGFDAFGGTVFQINTDGTGYTKLTSFNNPGDPGRLSGLLLSGGNLYCTTDDGGTDNYGTVFALALASTPVLLNIQLIGNTAVLNWSDPAFSLQSSATVTGVFTNITGAGSPYTNPIASSQKFFRLVQP